MILMNLNRAHVQDHLLKQLGTLIGPGICLGAKAYDILMSPCVYIAKGGQSVLYIGMSADGITRPTGRNHHKLKLIRPEITSLRIYPCKSTEEAREAERILIGLFKPKYNGRLHNSAIARLLGNAR